MISLKIDRLAAAVALAFESDFNAHQSAANVTQNEDKTDPPIEAPLHFTWYRAARVYVPRFCRPKVERIRGL